MIDQIVHRNDLRKTLSWLLRYFASAAVLSQKPRRRAGETPTPAKLHAIRSALPSASVNGAPPGPGIAPAARPSPPAEREIPIRE